MEIAQALGHLIEDDDMEDGLLYNANNTAVDATIALTDRVALA